jgi:hypothetical protein
MVFKLVILYRAGVYCGTHRPRYRGDVMCVHWYPVARHRQRRGADAARASDVIITR